MKTPKPVFRFLGEPGRMKLQFETTQLAQQFFLILYKEGCAGEGTEKAKLRFPSDIGELKQKLQDANVRIDRPPWFASLLSR